MEAVEPAYLIPLESWMVQMVQVVGFVDTKVDTPP